MIEELRRSVRPSRAGGPAIRTILLAAAALSLPLPLMGQCPPPAAQSFLERADERGDHFLAAATYETWKCVCEAGVETAEAGDQALEMMALARRQYAEHQTTGDPSLDQVPASCTVVAGGGGPASPAGMAGGSVTEREGTGGSQIDLATLAEAQRRGHDIGSLAPLRQLIEAGADVRQADEYGLTLLHYARTSEEVLLLVDAGADIDAPTNTGSTPLLAAAAEELTPVVKALLALGADPNIATRDHQRTPLMWATNRCEPDMVRPLVDYGADLGAVDDRGATPLHWAIGGGQTRAYTCTTHGEMEMIRLLVAAGADVNARTHNGQTPLRIAAGALFGIGGASDDQVQDLLRELGGTK